MVLTTSQMNDEIIIAVGHAINDKYIEIMQQEFDPEWSAMFGEKRMYELGRAAIDAYYSNRYSIEEEKL